MTSALKNAASGGPGLEPAGAPRPETPNHRRLSQQRVQMTRVGLVLPSLLSYDDWAQAGHQLSGIIDSSAWCLGDWLVYGKKHYSDRYQRAIQTAGLQYQTLRNYAWVARRFDLSRRRSALSFQHHAEVASLALEEQAKWLDAAEKHMWTSKQLRRQIQNGRINGAPSDPQAAAVIPRIQVVDSRLRRWQHAAEHLGAGFESWVVASLDQAAERVLSDPVPVDA